MDKIPEALLGKSLLRGPEVAAFLRAGVIHVFDPETRQPVATAQYHADGRVEMTLGEMHDTGAWGVLGDRYWTQYASFRDGQRHAFYLEPLGHQTVQAHFADGRRAFVQSHLAQLSEST